MDTIKIDRAAAQTAIANEVRAQIARRRLSAVRAAKALGWTQNYMARRMIGTVPFDAVDLLALAQLLDVPVTSFFGVGPDVITTRKTFALVRALSQATRSRLALAA